MELSSPLYISHKNNIKESIMASLNIDIINSFLRQGTVPVGEAFGSNTGTPASHEVVHAVVAELASLGFIITPFELSGVTNEFLESVLNSARSIVGVERFSTTPMYVNFPAQVKKMDTVELIVDQIVHYLSYGRLVPDHEDVKVRPGLTLKDLVGNGKNLNIREVDPLSEVERLVSKPVALSQNERDLVALLVWEGFNENISDWHKIYRDARNHENAQVLFSALIDLMNDKDKFIGTVLVFMGAANNADRLLRIFLSAYSTPSNDNREAYNRAVNELSDSDHWAVKMITAPKVVRRGLVYALSNVIGDREYSADALISRNELWKRVMRMVHPYGVDNMDDTSRFALDVIHENIRYETYNAVVERVMAEKDVKNAIKVLSQRPGNLLRRLVALARMEDFTRAQAREVTEIIDKANLPLTTLISGYNGVLNANASGNKIVRIKGANTVVDGHNVTAKHIGILSSGLKDAISKALAAKNAPVNPVGVIGEFPAPLVARDASRSDRELYRGQSIAEFEDNDTLRLFVHWVNNERVVDVDLGINVYDKDLDTVSSVNYTNYYLSRSYATFSGDLTNAPKPHGASEYFDVDVSKLRKDYPQSRWIALSAIVFSGDVFKSLDHVYGVMVRSDDEKGEIYDPRTVSASGSSVADSRSVTAMVVDLEGNRVFWVDSGVGNNRLYGNSTSQSDEIAAVIRTEVMRETLTAGELARMWATAHGVATVKEKVDMDSLESLL